MAWKWLLCHEKCWRNYTKAKQTIIYSGKNYILCGVLYGDKLQKSSAKVPTSHDIPGLYVFRPF